MSVPPRVFRDLDLLAFPDTGYVATVPGTETLFRGTADILGSRGQGVLFFRDVESLKFWVGGAALPFEVKRVSFDHVREVAKALNPPHDVFMCSNVDGQTSIKVHTIS